MFNLGWDEMAVIAVLALVVLGPKELPNALRTMTGLMRQVRKLAGEFQSGVNEIIREAELEEARKAIAEIDQKSLTDAIEKHVDADGSIKAAMQEPVDASINPAAIEEPAVLKAAALEAAPLEVLEGEAAGADVNPAVAAFAPGGSATSLPDPVEAEAISIAGSAKVDGDLTSTPVEEQGSTSAAAATTTPEKEKSNIS